MQKKQWLYGAVLGSLLLIVGCTGQPVVQVAEAPISANKPAVTMDDVNKAIVRAGTTLGWRLQTVSPGKIVGTLNLREHVAVVDIAYDTKTYSITYKDSRNLDYKGATIHRNYNGWVQNLDKSIRAQLMTL
jgi:hypothetical protein